MSLYKPIPLWKRAPFLRLLIPFVLGIIISEQFALASKYFIATAIVAAVPIVAIHFLPLHRQFALAKMRAVAILFLLFAAGGLLLSVNDTRHRYVSLDNYARVYRIAEPPEPKPKTFKLLAVIEQDDIQPANEGLKTILYLRRTNDICLLHYGDRIIISDSIQPIKNNFAQGNFDYETYCRRKGIIGQLFLRPNQFEKLKSNPRSFFNFVYSLRDNVVNILRQNIPGSDNIKGIAEALLIGYKTHLDKGLSQAYANTGTVHIIAISGMHLALIYAGLVWLCDRIRFIKKRKIARVLIILGSLWLFSLLTGACASVLRSAVMFTCMVIGQNFVRKSGVVNSIVTSGFILLAYDPFLLWDAGFQLSYAALIGIVWLQKPLERKFYFRPLWLRNIWALSSVTLAAQVLTLPFCLYYFGQFPLLFLLTNLVCVPLSTIILFGEIILLTVAFVPALSATIGKCIFLLIKLMNAFTYMIDGLSFASIKFGNVNALTAILLMAAIVLILRLRAFRRRVAD